MINLTNITRRCITRVSCLMPTLFGFPGKYSTFENAKLERLDGRGKCPKVSEAWDFLVPSDYYPPRLNLSTSPIQVLWFACIRSQTI